MSNRFHPTDGTPIDQTYSASTDQPVDETLALEPSEYVVTFSWTNGFHNIAHALPGNDITVDGVTKYYQVSGSADTLMVVGALGVVVP